MYPATLFQRPRVERSNSPGRRPDSKVSSESNRQELLVSPASRGMRFNRWLYEQFPQLLRSYFVVASRGWTNPYTSETALSHVARIVPIVNGPCEGKLSNVIATSCAALGFQQGNSCTC